MGFLAGLCDFQRWWAALAWSEQLSKGVTLERKLCLMGNSLGVSVGVRLKAGRKFYPAGLEWIPKDEATKGKWTLFWENFPDSQQLSV